MFDIVGASQALFLVMDTSTVLSAEQKEFYEKNGYLCPLRAFSEEQAAEFRAEFDSYTDEHREALKGLIPRQRRAVYSRDASCSPVGLSDRFRIPMF